MVVLVYQDRVTMVLEVYITPRRVEVEVGQEDHRRIVFALVPLLVRVKTVVPVNKVI
jgi:hypothetical protein